MKRHYNNVSDNANIVQFRPLAQRRPCSDNAGHPLLSASASGIGSRSATAMPLASLLLVCGLLLGGCSMQDTPLPVAAASPAPAPAVISSPPHVITAADRAEIRRLLQSARLAIDEGHLLAPPAASALAAYDRVLLMDPQNPEARYGIEGIVDRLIEQARTKADRREFMAAQQLLAQAMLVDPGHQGLRPALTELQLLETARRSVFRLDPRALDARSASVLTTLREAGRATRSTGCRAIIRARSDAEGRWIYQEMSAAPGRDRIRAQLTIAGTPSIENVCFQGAE